MGSKEQTGNNTSKEVNSVKLDETYSQIPLKYLQVPQNDEKVVQPMDVFEKEVAQDNKSNELNRTTSINQNYPKDSLRNWLSSSTGTFAIAHIKTFKPLIDQIKQMSNTEGSKIKWPRSFVKHVVNSFNSKQRKQGRSQDIITEKLASYALDSISPQMEVQDIAHMQSKNTENNSEGKNSRSSKVTFSKKEFTQF